MAFRAWLGSVRFRLAGKWQIPLLVVSVVVLWFGVDALVGHRRQVGIEQGTREAAAFVESQEFGRAANVVEPLLDLKMGDQQRRELYGILARALYGLEQGARVHDQSRAARFVSYQLRAVGDGKLNAQQHYRLGWAFSWLARLDKALDHFQLALSGGHGQVAVLHRQIAELLDRSDDGSVEQVMTHLDAILSEPKADQDDLVWAVGRKIEILLADQQIDRAGKLIEQDLPRVSQDTGGGEMEYLQALCEYHLGELEQSGARLNVVREQLLQGEPLGVKVALLLGWINYRAGRPTAGLSFMREVQREDYGSSYHVWALVGQGQCLVGLERYDEARHGYLLAIELLEKVGKNRGVDTEAILSSLQEQWRWLQGQGALEGALIFAKLQERFSDQTDRLASSALWAVLGQMHRDLGKELEMDLSVAIERDDREDLKGRVVQHFLAAANYYSKVLNVRGLDNRQVWAAMWSAVDCYDKAGHDGRTIDLLERFIHDWPTNDMVAQAVYRLGSSYRILGHYSQAAKYYRRAIEEFGRTPWGISSYVPLARCYMLEGPEGLAKAQEVLESIVDDRSDQQIFTPQAREFRSALFLLGQVYYQQSNYQQAISTLEQALQRYSDDHRCGQGLFVMARSYQIVAEQLAEQMQQSKDKALADHFRAGWQGNLTDAYKLYEAVVNFYQKDGQADGQADELGRTYLKLSYFYRADCQYDLGNYAAAIELYKQAGDAYEQDCWLPGAYVQIINAYYRMGQDDKIRVTLERMRWLLDNMAQAKGESEFAGVFDRRYWQDWLEWNYSSGLVKAEPLRLAISARE